MKKIAKRLREELDTFSSEQKMITVRRVDLERAVKELEWDSQEWSNQSCLGYVIQGLGDSGLR